MTFGFSASSSVKGLDEILGFESLPLSQVHSIEDGALTFYHVAREEEVSHDRVRPIINRCLRCRHTSIKVYRVHFISAVITLQMNGLRLSPFKIESSPNQNAHRTPSFK